MSSDSSSGLLTVSGEAGIKIFYDVTPALPVQKDRPVIVLSHSLSAATWLWDTFLVEFSSAFTIIRYDIRFHGRSPPAESSNFDYQVGHAIEDLASDVIKLLDEVGIQKAAAFVGLSIGGGIGVVLAADHSHRFGKILVVGTRAHATPGDDGLWDDRVAYAREHGMVSLAKQSTERWFSDKWRAANQEQAADIAAKVGTQSLEGYIANVQALRRLNLWPQAAAIRDHGDGDKVVFVVGEEDALPVIRETKELASLAGSQVVVVPDAGHITHVQQPERFFAIVREALEGPALVLPWFK